MRDNVIKELKEKNIKDITAEEFRNFVEEVELLSVERDTDELTGLLTREAFIRQAGELLRNGEPYSYILLCIDINNFREFNQRFGYDEGDRVLRYIGRISGKLHAGSKALMCRDKGDTFFVIEENDELLQKKSKTFVQYISEYKGKGGFKISRGSYVIEDPSIDIRRCMDHAYTAMKEAKNKPGLEEVRFDQSVMNESVKRQVLVETFEDSIANEDFLVYFQPKVDHGSGRIVGAESLIRWQHPEYGFLMPGEFIPLFEENGLIVDLDKYVLEQVCRLQKKLLAIGVEPVPISVNMSRYDVIDGIFVSHTRKMLEKYELPARYIHIEITETIFETNPEELKSTIATLKDLGISIELDDFGSGYSSLRTLMELPIDVVKLDTSIVQNADENYKTNLILTSSIRTAKWLGMTVVAEGVETNSIADRVFHSGCSVVQGYYYYRPMDKEAYYKLISKASTGEVILEDLKIKPIVAYEAAVVGDVFNIVLSHKDMSIAIPDALAMICEYLGLDRVFVFEDVSRIKVIRTFSWAKPGKAYDIKEIVYDHIRTPIDDYYDEYGIWAVADIDTQVADDAITTMKARNVRAFFYVEMFREEEFLGYIGFEGCEVNKGWDLATRETIRMVAKIISAVITENRAARGEELINEYYEAIDNQSDFVYIIGRDDYIIRYGNKVAIQKFKDMVGKCCYKYLMNRDTPCINCPVRHYKETGERRTVEICILDNLHMLLSISPISYEDDKAILCTCKDISEIRDAHITIDKKDEENAKLQTALFKLAEANKELERVTDQLIIAKTGLWIFETFGNKPHRLICNRGMKLLIGAPDDASPEECFDYWIRGIDGEHLAVVKQGIENMHKNGPAEVIFPWHDHRGNQIYVRAVGARNSDEPEANFSVAGYLQDVTSMVTTQLRQNKIITDLRLSRDSVENLLDKMNIGSWHIEKDEGQAPRLIPDPIMRRLIGAKPEDSPEVCYEKWIAGVSEKYLPLLGVLEESMRTQGLGEVEYPWTYPDGREIYVRCYGVKDKNYKENAQRFSGFHSEITDAHMLEEERESFAGVLRQNYFITANFNFQEDTVKFIHIGSSDGSKFIMDLYHGDKIYGIQQYLDNWAEMDVTIEERINCKDFLLLDKVRRRLNKENAISRDIKTISNGWVNIQVLALKRDENGDVLEATWMARIIDQEMSERLEANYRTHAFGRLFYSSRYIDLRTGTYITLDLSDGKLMDKRPKDFAKELGKYVDLYIDSERQEELRAFFDLTTMADRLENKASISIEYINKSERWVTGYFLPVDYDKDGKLRHVIYAVRDINDRKLKELYTAKRLEDAYNDAKMANEAKSDFLASMSHDIRTPLNAITGMVDIALNNVEDKDKTVDSLNKIKFSSKQLVFLINDILDISAIESGKFEMRPVPCNLFDEIEKVRIIFRSQLDSKSQISSFDCHDISQPLVMADSVRISQILNNIYGNAVKYTPEGGEINFDIHQEEKNGRFYTIFSIKDNGIGMEKEYMNHMFESFSRGTDTKINKVQGVGLGLAIVKQLVDAMGGYIEVESEIGHGSLFEIYLPLPIAEGVEQPNAVDVSLDSQLDMNLLIAEDNDMNWEIVKELLGFHGIKATRAENGRRCYEMFENSKPKTYDAILMDMQMPVMNGLDSTRHIRASSHEDAKTIPIIAMTANAFSDDVEACLASGMNEHLSKPFEIDKMLNVLSKYKK